MTRVKLCDGGWKAAQARIVGVLGVRLRVRCVDVEVRVAGVVSQVVEHALLEFAWRQDALWRVFGLHAMHGCLDGSWWFVARQLAGCMDLHSVSCGL